MDKKFVVAEGRAVTAKGVVFGPGELLPADALSAESVQTLLKSKVIVEAGSEAKAVAPVEEKKAEAEAPAQAEKPADEKSAHKGGDKKRK